MDLAQTQQDVARLKERTATQTKDISEIEARLEAHYTRFWKAYGALEKRVRSLEVRVAVIAALAGFGGAGIGSLAGGLASRFFQQ